MLKIIFIAQTSCRPERYCHLNDESFSIAITTERAQETIQPFKLAAFIHGFIQQHAYAILHRQDLTVSIQVGSYLFSKRKFEFLQDVRNFVLDIKTKRLLLSVHSKTKEGARKILWSRWQQYCADNTVCGFKKQRQYFDVDVAFPHPRMIRVPISELVAKFGVDFIIPVGEKGTDTHSICLISPVPKYCKEMKDFALNLVADADVAYAKILEFRAKVVSIAGDSQNIDKLSPINKTLLKLCDWYLTQTVPCFPGWMSVFDDTSYHRVEIPLGTPEAYAHIKSLPGVPEHINLAWQTNKKNKLTHSEREFLRLMKTTIHPHDDFDNVPMSRAC